MRLFSALSKSDFIPYSIKMGVGNDVWTYAISRNDDDLLSFSSNYEINANFWFYKLSMEGITNRGWKEGWPGIPNPDPMAFYNGRYDIITNHIGININLFDSERLKLILRPKLGFNIIGNIGFDTIQNFIHRISNIPRTELPYDIDKKDNIYSPLFGISSHLSYIPMIVGKSKLGFEIGYSKNFFLDYENDNSLTGSIFLEESDRRYFTLSLGYSSYKNFTELKTHSLLIDNTEGFQLSFEYSLGPVNFTYTHPLGHTQGFTIVSIDFLCFFKESTWQKSDISISHGFLYLLENNHANLEIEKPLADNLSLVAGIKHTQTNGKGLYVYAGDDPDQFYRIKPLFSSYLLGLKYYLPVFTKTGDFNLYTSIQIGLGNYRIIELSNMASKANLPLTVIKENMQPLLDIKMGVDVFKSGMICFNNANLNLSLFIGIHIYQDYKAIQEILSVRSRVENISYENNPLSTIQPYIGLAMKVGLDI